MYLVVGMTIISRHGLDVVQILLLSYVPVYYIVSLIVSCVIVIVI